MKNIVEAENLSKTYPLFKNKKDCLLAVLGRKYTDVFCALQDISFNLKPGDRLGLLGLNGAGKSTLLKILAGVLEYEGRVVVNGTKHAILEAGIGLDTHLTGVEAAKRLMMLYGVASKKIGGFLDEIFEFAELEEWRNRKLFTYSAGMKARVLFSILTSVPADVYIVDEFIAVGDEHFIGKSQKRFSQLVQKGNSCVIASHDVTFLERACNKVIWVDYGKIKEFGDPSMVIENYRRHTMGKTFSLIPNHENDNCDSENTSWDPDPDFYQKYLKIQSCEVILSDNTLLFTIKNKVIKPVKDCRVYLNIASDEGLGFISKSEFDLSPGKTPYDLKKIILKFYPLFLVPGKYRYSFYITPLHTEGIKRIYDMRVFLSNPTARFCVEGQHRNSIIQNLNLKWIRRC